MKGYILFWYQGCTIKYEQQTEEALEYECKVTDRRVDIYSDRIRRKECL